MHCIYFSRCLGGCVFQQKFDLLEMQTRQNQTPVELDHMIDF